MQTVQPLSRAIPIANPDGTPTDFFLRWAASNHLNIDQLYNNCIVRYQGSLDGDFDPTKDIFSIPMEGDEIFEPGLPDSVFIVDGMTTGTAQFPIKVNGVPVGYMTWEASGGKTRAVVTMKNKYTAAKGDIFSFWWPNPMVTAITGIHFLFNGSRDTITAKGT